MKQTISIGAQSFEFIRKNHCFLVDKTGLIREWWENADSVTLITRPRRFGKTLNLDMLDCFFSKKYEGRADLFEGTAIWEEEKYRRLQGTYPVIFLSFANIKGAAFEEAKLAIKHVLAKLYEIHRYVRDGEGMGKTEQDFFDSVSPKMTDDVAVFALHNLSDYMSRYYGQKVLIFLDEYDTPLQEAYVQGYWKELTQFIRSLFNAAFKTNPYMERAIMTGITRVSKESIFSDLNNLTVVTTTSESYCRQFGFTGEEVFQTLNEFGMSHEAENVKNWYDGFTFGSQRDIYNPWSIINFLKFAEFKPYWANSSSNHMINLLIRQGDPQTKTVVEDLLGGGALETELDEEIIFDQLQKKRGAVWSMLLASGYLKVAERTFSRETRRFTYRLKLTNWEVEMMLRDMIRDWFGAQDVPYQNFVRALLLDDAEAMTEFMNEIALVTFSSFDIAESAAKNDAPERFYHGFVLGLMVELADRFEITSNRESGFGRYDIMLIPRRMGELHPIIIEFKVRKPRREASLEETAAAALKQIEERNYDAALVGRGFDRGQIRRYGFAFEGKKVLIGEG